MKMRGIMPGLSAIAVAATPLTAAAQDPKGIHVFPPNGRFFPMIARPDLPKIASNDATNPTADMAMHFSNHAAVGGGQ